MSGCKCELGLSNTGQPNCETLQSVTTRMIMQPIYNGAGTKNFIDLTSLPTWSDLINEPDATKRWFPLPTFENVDLPKADSTFEEAPSGRKVFIKQGKRSFTGELWAESPQFLGKIEGNRCVEFGVYLVDTNGNLVGSKEGNKLYPIPVDNQSFDAKLMFATDTAIQKIMVSFDFYRLFVESTLWMITPTEAGEDFNTIEGLLDVNLAFSNITDTGVTATATLDYGTAINPLKAKGLVLADFELLNVTQSSTISITSVTEGADGVYVLVYPTQAGATDILKLSVVKAGFEGSGTYQDA